MPDPRAVAREHGIAIELADCGTWGAAALVSEYDPAGPVIRINARALPDGPADAIRAHVDRAVIHELYHHAEARGAIVRLPGREARERAAGEYTL